jgi:Skp family chaperone for outer membrane proteins
MIKMRFAALAAVLAAAGSLTAFAQQATQAGVSGLIQDGKVVVMNTAIFPSKIEELKQKYDQVQGLYKDRYAKLQALNGAAVELDNKLKTQGQTLAPDKAQEMNAQLEEMKRRGSREVEDLQADYKKSLEDQVKPIQAKLSQFVQNYASRKGIILVLDLPGAYQTGTLAYWSPATDITEDFISEYNKANPVPGAAPAAAGPPAAKPKP